MSGRCDSSSGGAAGSVERQAEEHDQEIHEDKQRKEHQQRRHPFSKENGQHNQERRKKPKCREEHERNSVEKIRGNRVPVPKVIEEQTVNHTLGRHEGFDQGQDLVDARAIEANRWNVRNPLDEQERANGQPDRRGNPRRSSAGADGIAVENRRNEEEEKGAGEEEVRPVKDEERAQRPARDELSAIALPAPEKDKQSSQREQGQAVGCAREIWVSQ